MAERRPADPEGEDPTVRGTVVLFGVKTTTLLKRKPGAKRF